MDIFCVHFVYQSAVMFYIAKHLSSSPHYQISPDKVPEWEARIHRYNETADKEVAIEILEAKEGRSENHFMTVWHGMVGLAALFASLDWWRVITDIVRRMQDARLPSDNRNHDSVDAGSTGNTNQHRTRHSLGLSSPYVHQATAWESMKELMHWCSVAIRTVFPLEGATIYQGDDERRRHFAEHHMGVVGDFIETLRLIFQ